MNFPPFGGHFPSAIPAIHQFAAKFGQEGPTAGLCPGQENAGNRYTANGVPSFTQHHPPSQQQMLNAGKYQGNYGNQSVYGHAGVSAVASIRQEKRQGYEGQELAQELCAAMLNQNQHQHQQDKAKDSQENDRRPQQAQPWQSLATPGSAVADYLSHLPASTLPLSLHHFLKYSAENIKKEGVQQLGQGPEPALPLLNNPLNVNLNMNSTLNSITSPPTQSIATTTTTTTSGAGGGHHHQQQPPQSSTKKKKKKKAEKEKKPRPKPGEIRLTTALDGSTLYCCPECHMAYPEKELLEQHLVGHTLERRFVCDICGAGLKRKDHLTRHKQSHNPERPYVCTVCLKAFKRKEQLTLHFVIHSGEKRHVCTECGKGFYRKDHLRKHTRSHIARRVRAELSQQGNSTGPSLQLQVAAPTSAAPSIIS